MTKDIETFVSSGQKQTSDLRTMVSAARKQWEIDHPEEVEAARLKTENAKLKTELEASKARGIANLAERHSNRRLGLAFSIYGAGAVVIGMLFRGTCPSCAYNGYITATAWDFLAMFVWAGWGLGGFFVGQGIADKLLRQKRRRAE